MYVPGASEFVERPFASRTATTVRPCISINCPLTVSLKNKRPCRTGFGYTRRFFASTGVEMLFGITVACTSNTATVALTSFAVTTKFFRPRAESAGIKMIPSVPLSPP